LRQSLIGISDPSDFREVKNTHMRRFSTKAQMEIIGVLLIVIILIFAAVLMIMININRAMKTPASTVADAEMAQSLIDAVMNTRAKNNFRISEIVANCFDARKNDLCKESDIDTCCKYAQLSIEDAMIASLQSWKKSYRLDIYQKGTNNRIIQLITNDAACKESSLKEQPGYYEIPGDPPIIAELIICRR
jgi:ABC-type transport system involved in Fe-S cluster assembly fused permease/ATPase subunit